jgi:hypothetical protein
MRKQVFIFALVVVSILSASCKAGSLKSGLQSEAESHAHAWFDRGFIKCGEDYFSNFDNDFSAIYVSKYGLSRKKGLFQFKNLSYSLKEDPVTSTEKLNGIEWKGTIASRYTQFRYYDGKTWSPWEDVLIQFSDELMKGISDVLNEPNSPMFSPLEKGTRGWVGITGHWKKPSCSELPAA